MGIVCRGCGFRLDLDHNFLKGRKRKKMYDTVPVLVYDDWLFVGSATSAMNFFAIKEYKITHIFSAIGPSQVKIPGVVYDNVNIMDDEMQSLEYAIDKFIPFVLSARREGGKVLVHCYAGISRSVSLILAYLIISHGYSFQKALSMVKKSRPIANPNPGFKSQLLTMSNILSRSISSNVNPNSSRECCVS